MYSHHVLRVQSLQPRQNNDAFIYFCETLRTYIEQRIVFVRPPTLHNTIDSVSLVNAAGHAVLTAACG